MTIAPLPRARSGYRSTQSEPARNRKRVTKGSIARRHRMVMWSKRLMPVLAMLLLASIALWPEISQQLDQGRIKYRRGLSGQLDAGQLRDARYRGVDGRGRPYAVTADLAAQDGPERLNLTEPKGDVVSENGTWIMVQSQKGVYLQHTGQLDLSGNATVYRDDGITMHTDAVAVDVKSGAAASNEKTHVEGPFGTLDSQGFALVDKGSVVQFSGPSRLLLNGSHR